MLYRIRHVTRYSGNRPVSVGKNQAWLRPRDLPQQTCRRFTLDISPDPSVRGARRDYFGNEATHFAFDSGYDTLTVTARSEVEVRPLPPPAAEAGAPWEQVRDALRQPTNPDALDAAQFRCESPRVHALPAAAEYAATSFPPGRPLLESVLDLTARMHADFQYRPQSTTVSTPIEEVFRTRAGVCQDFAHLEIALLRELGLAARYVSGYLRTIPPPGQPRRVGADASHAWLSVYCGSAGWIDFDPTNNLLVGPDHVTVAWGRDYDDVPPLRGVFIGGEAHALQVEVDVEPVEEPPAARPPAAPTP